MATDDIERVLEERGNNYGEFHTHANITQEIKAVMQRSDAWPKMNNSQKEALEMVAHKIGRICNGNPNYKDSWTDIIGYIRLVEKTL